VWSTRRRSIVARSEYWPHVRLLVGIQHDGRIQIDKQLHDVIPPVELLGGDAVDVERRLDVVDASVIEVASLQLILYDGNRQQRSDRRALSRVHIDELRS
jgi:hypothetical protein